jgi:hypothetical protein
MANNNQTPNGFTSPSTNWDEYNRIAFTIQQALIKMQTSTLVQVVSCTNAGSLSPVGYVDVIPMVHQIDSDGVPMPHVTIFNIPYLRIQGGSNAIIIDPVAGDIGICCFASRDITKVKNSKKPSPPDSRRKYDFSDGMYMGGMLNGTPSQFIQFHAGGIQITSPNPVTINSSAVVVNAPTTTVNSTTSTFNGNVVINGSISQGVGGSGGSATLIGPLSVTNDVVSGGTSLKTHIHSGVTVGGGNTGAPV